VKSKIVLLAGIGCASLGILQAQAAKSVWDGIYSAAQATRGLALYEKECSSCHGPDLSGSGQMPGLSGEDFRKEWEGDSVGDLFERMRVSMPGDHPGTLSREQNADILAFILKSNQFPAGQAELKGDTDVLNKIRFTAKK
jgi:S-disulfanyl-L-cysteine oxidoreductase SoxD